MNVHAEVAGLMDRAKEDLGRARDIEPGTKKADPRRYVADLEEAKEKLLAAALMLGQRIDFVNTERQQSATVQVQGTAMAAYLKAQYERG